MFASAEVISKRCVHISLIQNATHYETLQISPKATQQQIKDAYFSLTKLYHPDCSTELNAAAKFGEIAEAYRVLGDAHRRSAYDRTLGPVGGDHLRYSRRASAHAHPLYRAHHRPTPAAGFAFDAKYDFQTFYRMHYPQDEARLRNAATQRRRSPQQRAHVLPSDFYGATNPYVMVATMVTASLFLFAITR